jgi:hypothetical protein
VLARLHVEHQIEPQHSEQETGACRGECMHIEAPGVRFPHHHIARSSF